MKPSQTQYFIYKTILQNAKITQFHQQQPRIQSSPYLTMMLNAPSGVTRTAGAKIYAIKFATSPIITVSHNSNQSKFYPIKKKKPN